MTAVTLPGGERYRLRGGEGFAPPVKPFRSRVALAAAHVVADPLGETVPGAPSTVDWEATLEFRHHLWRYGFGVAEAMDTAQRGMGLDYPTARELVRRAAAEARSVGGLIVAGVGTDQLPPDGVTLDDVRRAYTEQLSDVLDAGAVPVLMCSRQLAQVARHTEDYLRVYAELIGQSTTPVVLHWLGEAFDPQLRGYWGSSNLDAASAVVLQLIKDHADMVDGIKLSLLDADREVGLRNQLPTKVRLYTGDDFNYPSLILGDEEGYSDALLGIFDPIAPAAAAALTALDDNDLTGYAAAFGPTVPLSRHLFAAPTSAYKAGIVFLAWLCGHQDHFTMVGGLHAARSPMHLAEALRLADAAGLLPDAELAAARARMYFATAGVEQ
jgi:uncharacterized protein DUF993